MVSVWCCLSLSSIFLMLLFEAGFDDCFLHLLTILDCSGMLCSRGIIKLCRMLVGFSLWFTYNASGSI